MPFKLAISVRADTMIGFLELRPTISFDGKLSESSVFYFDGCNQWFSAIAADSILRWEAV